MRPKLTTRLNAKGEPIYTYLCSTKERSRGHVCGMKNCSGNALDGEIIGRLKSLREDSAGFIRQLKQRKRHLTSQCQSDNVDISGLEADVEAAEEEISGLVSALGKASGTTAEEYILKKIDVLHEKEADLKHQIAKWKELSVGHELTDDELARTAQRLSSFEDTVDGMTVEQKRAAIRGLVQKILWDGQDAHVFLFGTDVNAEPLGENSK